MQTPSSDAKNGERINSLDYSHISKNIQFTHTSSTWNCITPSKTPPSPSGHTNYPHNRRRRETSQWDPCSIWFFGHCNFWTKGASTNVWKTRRWYLWLPTNVVLAMWGKWSFGTIQDDNNQESHHEYHTIWWCGGPTCCELRSSCNAIVHRNRGCY